MMASPSAVSEGPRGLNICGLRPSWVDPVTGVWDHVSGSHDEAPTPSTASGPWAAIDDEVFAGRNWGGGEELGRLVSRLV